MKLLRGKKGRQNRQNIFLTILPRGKKGMEMWQLVLLIVALVLMFILLWWYADLKTGIGSLLNKLGEMFYG